MTILNHISSLKYFHAPKNNNVTNITQGPAIASAVAVDIGYWYSTVDGGDALGMHH